MDRIVETGGVNHIVSLNERKSIVITGVKKIESFDNEEFLLSTNLGMSSVCTVKCIDKAQSHDYRN